MAIGNFMNKAKEAAASLKDAAKEAASKHGLMNDAEAEKLDEASNQKTDKLKAVFEEVANASGLIKEAGYELDEIELELSLPPKVISHYVFLETISEEKKEELLERTKDNKMIRLVLKSLFKASSLQSTMKIGKYKMFEVEIEIGMIPAVKLKFNKKFHLMEQKQLAE